MDSSAESKTDDQRVEEGSSSVRDDKQRVQDRQSKRPAAPVRRARKIQKSAKDLASKPRSYFLNSRIRKFSAGLESVLFIEGSRPTINFGALSDNRILIPRISIKEHIYPSLKISNGKSFQFNVRSQIVLEHERAQKSNGRDQLTTQFRAEPGEISAIFTPSADFSLTVGRQNFQWGPSDLGSPSNWIFRPTRLADTLTSTPQSPVDTRDLARMNFSFGQHLSVVAMAEYEPEAQSRPRLFTGRRALIKPEVSWNNGISMIGLVVGGAETQRTPFFGQYLSFAFTDSFHIFADGAQYRGGEIALPRRLPTPEALGAGPVVVYQQSELEKWEMNYEVVGGLRYTTDGGLELRAEGYAQSLGLDSASLSDVRLLQQSESPFLPIFFQPGAEIQSKSGYLIGLRSTNLGGQNTWNTILRYLKPSEDSSGLALGYFEYLYSDSSVFFMSVGGYHGDTISAAALPQRFSFSLGQKHVW